MSRRAAWGTATLLATLGLAVQVFWLQFDTWSRTPNLRAAYTAACAVLPCTVPAQRAPQHISVRGLAVRAHPRVAGGLVVEATLVNEASFAQPFPVLELRLWNLAGEAVAMRRCEPEEYLPVSRGAGAVMPTMTPVRTALAFRSAPWEAVNVTLEAL